MNASLRLDDELRTDTGCVRAANEDSAIALSRDQLWVVADGMGGHVNGKYASESIIRSIESATLPDTLDAVCEVVAGAVHAANDKLFGEATKASIQMGSTVVALIIRDRRFAILWAGDSRAYVYRDHRLHQLTVDHSQVQEMVDRGLLTPEQAVDHPMTHVLARAVGVQEALSLDAIRDEVASGDIFLLCSDGLHGTLTDTEIAAIIERHGIGSAAALVTLCLERGAPDNVTVAVIQATEPTALIFAAAADAL